MANIITEVSGMRLTGILIVFSLLLSGCAVNGSDLPMTTAAALDRVGSANTDESYVLGAGDEVAFSVYGEPELTKTYKVGPDGFIEMLMIGPVKASGMTVSALSTEVRDRLADGFIRRPSVSASILVFRPFYILGEVNKPGEYAYRDGLTLAGAVALAGGYSYRAQQKYAFIRPEKTDEQAKVEASPELGIRPGDTILIPERFF